MRVGLLGGTFDPIHLGHLAAAATAAECAQLDSILLVPAGRPPHKGEALASVEDRLAMCRLAAADAPGLSVWDWEARRSGPSFTVDTLEAFRAQRPGDQPHLILGWDAARDLPQWRRPAEVLALAELVIVSRPGMNEPREEDLVSAGIDPRRATLCLAPTPDVAATRIRSLAAGGKPLTGLVPPAVETYIRAHRLYDGPRQDP
ncbi:MAG TPA: nicotinate (nicotinamide) nucleotide adenylyltransferase [Candidatus Dormibacteraeota bacterium]|nr:nicotinate (nicotinamide) nucleotide adenylyltransferase [Candidatus Dormibacteraeota bacterium]